MGLTISGFRELVFPHEPHCTPKKPVLLQMSESQFTTSLIQARVLLVASVLYDALLNNCKVTLR